MINSDALTARVIHIDSRLRKSGRAEDLVYELNEPIHLPRGVVCWCASLSVPYPWQNVCALNDQLYYAAGLPDRGGEQLPVHVSHRGVQQDSAGRPGAASGA